MVERGFKRWLQSEAIADDSLFRLSKHSWTGSNNQSNTYINRTIPLYMDDSGIVHRSYPDDYDKPYIVLNVSDRAVQAQKLHPQSKLFADLIKVAQRHFRDIQDWSVQIYNASHPQTARGKHYRTVGYWLGQTVSNSLPEYLYHGTSTNLWYDGIKQRGLLPRRDNLMGAGGSYGSHGDSLSLDDRVYLSAHPDASARSAASQSVRNHGGEPMILRIRTDQLFPNLFAGDEDSKNADDYKTSFLRMGSISYKGRVPPQAIEPFQIGKRSEGSAYYDKWERFHDVELGEHPLTGATNNLDFGLTSSPYYYALLDAGYVKDKDNGTGTELVKPISDIEMRQLIRNSPWVQNAARILADMRDWGMKGVKSLKNAPAADLPPILDDILIGSNLVSNRGGYLEPAYYPEQGAIEAAKRMMKYKLDYRQLIKMIDDFLASEQAKRTNNY